MNTGLHDISSQLINEDELMSREEFLKEQGPDYAERYLGEMATIGGDENLHIRVQVNPNPNRRGNPYLKVFNNTKPIVGKTGVARFHFFDSGMEYHKDKYLDWHVTKDDIKNIIKFLNMPSDDFPGYTNWQIACYRWNQEYGFTIKKDYLIGKYDKEFSDHPSYIPSTCKMPDTWVYGPPKKKSK